MASLGDRGLRASAASKNANSLHKVERLKFEVEYILTSVR